MHAQGAISTDEQLAVAVNAAVKLHGEELQTALRLYGQRMRRVIVDAVVDDIFDSIFNVESAKARLRPYLTKRVDSNFAPSAHDLAHLHDVVAGTFSPILERASTAVTDFAASLVSTASQHLELVVMPSLTRAATSIVVADRHQLTERHHNRVEFVQAEMSARVAMIANHEARELNEHVTAVLLGRRAGAAKPGTTTTGGAAAQQVDVGLMLSECARRLKPDTLQRMSSEEAKDALLQSYKRETSAWQVVQESQARIVSQEAREEERRRQFELTTRSEAAAAVQRAEAETAAIQGELNRLRSERGEMQDAMLKAVELIQTLDERCACLTLKLDGLIQLARLPGAPPQIPVEFAKAERELLKLRHRGVRTDSSNHDVAKAADVVKASTKDQATVDDALIDRRSQALARLRDQKLICDLPSIPRGEAALTQRVFAETVLDVAAYKQQTIEAVAKHAQVEKQLRTATDAHRAEVQALRDAMRQMDNRLCRMVRDTADEKMRAQRVAGALHTKLMEATVEVHVAGDEIVDDLARRIEALEADRLVSRGASRTSGDVPAALPHTDADGHALHKTARSVVERVADPPPSATTGATPLVPESADGGGCATAPSVEPRAPQSRPPSGRRLPPRATSSTSSSAGDVMAARPLSARSATVSSAKPGATPDATPDRRAADVPSRSTSILDDEWLADFHNFRGMKERGHRPASAVRPTGTTTGEFTPRGQYELGIYRQLDMKSPRSTRPHSAVSPRAAQLRSAMAAVGGKVPRPPIAGMKIY